MGNTGSTAHPSLDKMQQISKQYTLNMAQIEFLFMQFSHPASLAENQKFIMKMVLANLYDSPPTTFDDFLSGFAAWRDMKFEERCEFIFDMLDQDDDGCITASDLTVMIQHINNYHFELGDKVKVRGTMRKGVLRYWGKTKFSDGVWAGLELDEPTGAHDGTVEGETYFKTEEKHGAFVRREFLEHEDHYNIASEMLKEMGGTIDFEKFKVCMEPLKADIMVDPLPSGLE